MVRGEPDHHLLASLSLVIMLVSAIVVRVPSKGWMMHIGSVGFGGGGIERREGVG